MINLTIHEQLGTFIIPPNSLGSPISNKNVHTWFIILTMGNQRATQCDLIFTFGLPIDINNNEDAK